MNHSVEALISFNEGHQSLLKLYMHLGWGVSAWGKKGRLRYNALLQGSPLSASFHYGNLIFGIWCYCVMPTGGIMVSKSKFQFSNRISLPGRGEHEFAFQSWCSEPSVKNSGVRDRRTNFVIFVVWSALNVSSWVVVGWSRKSCLRPPEILSLCSWFN